MTTTSGLESGLDTQDRARCTVMARWLGASSALGTMALGAALVIAFGCVAQAWRDDAIAIVLLVLALTPVERYLALRLRFDAELFADLAGGRIADLAALDAGLAMLGVRKPPQHPRTLDDRLAGSRRLWRFHAVVATLMAVGTGVAVVFA
ncbi:MAG: hypothetical protein WAZ48_12505 [Lysobacteraceae bacterium]